MRIFCKGSFLYLSFYLQIPLIFYVNALSEILLCAFLLSE